MVNNCLLKTVRFVDTKQWNVKHFFATSIISRYPTESIGKHTVHITEKTKLFNEPEKEHKILGISNEKGMFDAYVELGKNINQAYIYVENGCLAYNPYRINVGSIGLKTDLQKNEYISPAYVVFKCKDTLLPEFLYLVLKSTVFNSIIRENTTGSVRQTLSYDNLAVINIPVPSIETQKQLLMTYHSALKEAERIKEEAEKLDVSISDKSTRHFPTCSHNFPKAGEARFQGRSRLFRLLGKFPYLGESRRILMAVSSKTSSKTRFYYAATRRISSAAVQPSIWA